MPLAIIYQPGFNSVSKHVGPNYHHVRNLSRYGGHAMVLPRNLTNATSQIIVTKRRKQGDVRTLLSFCCSPDD